jgi:hypothetical protein
MNLPVLKLSTPQHGCAASAQRWKRTAIPRSPAATPGFLVCCSLSVIEWHRAGKRPFFRWCVEPLISPDIGEAYSFWCETTQPVPEARFWDMALQRQATEHTTFRRRRTDPDTNVRAYARTPVIAGDAPERGHLCCVLERRQASAYCALNRLRSPAVP